MKKYHIKPVTFARPWLINGVYVSNGFNIVDGELRFINVCPGAGWFQTIRDALLGVWCLEEAKGSAQRFHDLYRAAKHLEQRDAA